MEDSAGNVQNDAKKIQRGLYRPLQYCERSYINWYDIILHAKSMNFYLFIFPPLNFSARRIRPEHLCSAGSWSLH